MVTHCRVQIMNVISMYIELNINFFMLFWRTSRKRMTNRLVVEALPMQFDPRYSHFPLGYIICNLGENDYKIITTQFGR